MCFGDSNTYGMKPDRSGRYAANERWTGLLQKQLGDSYYIIEEGLGGRTTDLDHYNPEKPSRNGFTYFKACLDSHLPLDIIVIMLGTNDLKVTYNRSVEDIADALRQYPVHIREYCTRHNLKIPKIILVSPPLVDEYAPGFSESLPTPGVYDGASQKSQQLAEPIKRLAAEMDCIFLDAAPITKTGDDGCHIDIESHKNLAGSLTSIVKGLATGQPGRESTA